MKANILSPTLNLPREDWLALRRKGIGGSDAGTVLGVNAYRSRLSLWKEKVGVPDEPVEETTAMRMGTLLEPIVIRLFEEQSGKTVHRVHSVLQSRDPDLPFVLGNVDGRIVGERAGFEAKTSASAEPWNLGEIPDAYQAQIQHLMALTGYTHYYICCLVQGRSLFWQRVERDEGYIQRLLEEERRFWRLVTTGVPPEPTPTERLRELQRIAPREDMTIDLDPEKAERLLQIERDLDMLAEEKESLRADLLQSMGAASVGTHAGPSGRIRVTFRMADGRASFDTDRFRTENRELFDRYVVRSEARRAPRFYLKAA